MSFLTVIPETQLSTFALSSSLYPSPSSPSSTQAAAPLSPEPNTQQLSMPTIDVGNDPGSGSESDTDLSYFESESSCSELAVGSHTQSTEAPESRTSGAGPTISYYHLPLTRARTTVYALWHYAAWSYSQLQQEFNIPLSTLHRIIYGTGDAEKKTKRNQYPSCGCRRVIDSTVKQQLINAATAIAQNRHLPLALIAEQVGIKISARALRRARASKGYHRCVVRVKPFLSPAARVKRNAWAEEFRDWSIQDCADVIWSDEYAFSPGQVSGTVWVTRRPGEEYIEDC